MDNTTRNSTPNPAGDPTASGPAVPTFQTPAPPGGGHPLAQGTPAQGPDLANSGQTPQAGTGTVQIDANYMYRAINDLQAQARNRDNEENRATLLIALNAMTKQANHNEQQLISRKEEDKYQPDAVVKKSWKAGFDDGHTIFNWDARRDYQCRPKGLLAGSPVYPRCLSQLQG